MSETQTTVPEAGCPVPAESLPHGHRAGTASLALGALGVVYGDIGTSPLYSVKESLHAATGGAVPTPDMILGVVSLVLWTLVVVVMVKYVLLVLRADNEGEGGTLTLMALVQRVSGTGLPIVGILGMLGISLFYGDAVITPALSVLSAVEGLNLVTPAFGPYVVPLSVVILIGLFAIQSKGTARVAAWFGPITATWFAAMAIAGIPHLVGNPAILAALNPYHGIAFLASHGVAGFLALGSVFLAVTGVEALYADMGHFGRRPIRAAWIFVVFPALVLNYLGQGAMLLTQPERAENPFFLLFPDWALIPMVLLATVATVIASQAVISGAFSLSQQAVQLGLLPRMTVRRTSETEKGQIYIPRINWLLLALVLLLVVTFRSSHNLAAAYGIAVTGDMVVTSLLMGLVAWKVWKWTPLTTMAVVLPFLAFDLVFLSANILKVPDGGWMPILVAGIMVVVMMTWMRGVRILREKGMRDLIPLDSFIGSMERSSVARVEGTAVFLTPFPDNAPPALLHNLKHNRVLHAHNVILVVQVEETPRVDPMQRATIVKLSESFSRVTLHFGYMEEPNVFKALPLCRRMGWKFDVMRTSFFGSRRTLRAAAKSRMPAWQDRLFISLHLTSTDASRHFCIPSDRSIDVGTVITI